MDERTENIIEMASLVQQHMSQKNVTCLSWETLKLLICDWAGEFEDMHAGTDWNEKDYRDELETFTNRKLAQELWESLQGAKISRVTHALVKSWNGHPEGTTEGTLWRWFEEKFGVSVYRDLIAHEKPQAAE